jgi:hypothetical protein
MKRFIAALAVVLLGLPMAARASCIGSDTLATCTDDNGNSYTVSRMGGTTFVNGSNPDGSDWSETSQTMGNMTVTNGESNGQPWNMTQQSNGGMTTYSGTNVAGEPFFHTCTGYGCN